MPEFDEPAPFSKGPLETTLRSFAADFRRFTDEWKGATI